MQAVHIIWSQLAHVKQSNTSQGYEVTRWSVVTKITTLLQHTKWHQLKWFIILAEEFTLLGGHMSFQYSYYTSSSLSKHSQKRAQLQVFPIAQLHHRFTHLLVSLQTHTHTHASQSLAIPTRTTKKSNQYQYYGSSSLIAPLISTMSTFQIALHRPSLAHHTNRTIWQILYTNGSSLLLLSPHEPQDAQIRAKCNVMQFDSIVVILLLLLYYTPTTPHINTREKRFNQVSYFFVPK